ncbi:MAG: ATP-binding cassette domain-containing protein, partial [Cenarchaeum sp. SB0673_bin_9]|nr:ATP-binding cassette domain-containing protein [Cenarchaeum sp. SB0673_bin_9]
MAKKNDITVIVGPNGCGKSTLLKSIFGLTTIYSGNIIYQGDDITKLAPHQVTRKRIAYLPQVNNVFVNLTIRENLFMASYTLTKKEFHDRLPAIYSTFPILEEYQ